MSFQYKDLISKLTSFTQIMLKNIKNDNKTTSSQLKNISKNIRNGFQNNRVFEVSSVFFGENDEDQKMAISAVREGSATGRHWDSKERKVDVYDIKSDALEVLFALGVDETKVTLLKNAPNWFHPGKSGSFNMGKIQLGYFGEIHPGVLKQLDVENRMVGFEICLAIL